MQQAINCNKLVKRYDKFLAVDHIDLHIPKGICFGLLGPNGAGKTTTVEMLEGIRKPDEGTIELFGVKWGGGSDHQLRMRIGVQLQETQLADKLHVEETIALFRSFYKNGKDTDEVISLLGLEKSRKKKVFSLSGGQRQRLALACALVSDPELLFLDEPTTGLDPQARLRIWEVVETYLSHQGTVLLTTHYMEEAARLCDTIAIMDEGKIIALGTPQELINSLNAEQIITFKPEHHIALDNYQQLRGITSVSELHDQVRLTSNDLNQALPDLIDLLKQHGNSLQTMATHQPTLEDVFVSLTGKQLRDNG